MNTLYRLEVEQEKAKLASSGKSMILSKEMLSSLPEPLARYMVKCGYEGRELAPYVELVWSEAAIKMSEKGKFMKMKCYQHNFSSEPCRLVYMKSRIAGLIPFEGRDKFQDGKGNMLIRLLKLFIIADVKGEEMDASALVTVLAEMPMIPASCFMPYITWEGVDINTVRGRLSFNGIVVSGLFSFNSDGEYVSFTTDDRYQSQKDGSHKNVRWSVAVGEYIKYGDISIPTLLTASWNQEGGDFQYFRGKIAGINF
ncbi:MAG: hypothetical protein PHT25_02840 [Bacteroidales bacterium]|nr:hypothetical protein [Bacteroidales bacterium]